MNKLIFLATITGVANANFALDYLNSLRSKSGANYLKYNSILEKAAYKHAKYLALNQELEHFESPSKRAFYGVYPWDRTIKAGYSTKVVVENLSFYEKNFKKSIDKLMGTIYHRLAFLDFRVDNIGFAKYKSRYVYEMSNSKIASICKKNSSSANFGVENLCKDRKEILEQKTYNRAILSTLAKSKKISIYPYRNQKNVPLKLVEERPKFLYGRGYGFGITARFNNYYVNSVSLRSFKLYKGNQEVKSKIVTFSNDIQNKLDKFTFVLVPTSSLKPKTTYKVVLKVKENQKPKTYSWRFTTK